MGEETSAAVNVKNSPRSLTVAGQSQTRVHFLQTLVMEGAEEGKKCVALGNVFKLEGEGSGATTGQAGLSEGGDSQSLVGAVLFLDPVATHALRLTDVRLLWSEDARFIDQFTTTKESTPATPGTNPATPGTNPATLGTFRPFSLYPVRFVHDVSFWENPARLFDQDEWLDIVRDVCDEAVVSAALVDRYERAADATPTRTVSRCYRLVFQSRDRALSYITSWKLQSLLRLRVAPLLGVEMR